MRLGWTQARSRDAHARPLTRPPWPPRLEDAVARACYVPELARAGPQTRWVWSRRVADPSYESPLEGLDVPPFEGAGPRVKFLRRRVTRRAGEAANQWMRFGAEENRKLEEQWAAAVRSKKRFGGKLDNLSVATARGTLTVSSDDMRMIAPCCVKIDH